MSRSGYTDDCDNDWEWIRWRGAVKSTLRGRRGQAFLRELGAALDAMPDKRLGSGSIVDDSTGCMCTLGVVAQARGMDTAALDDAFDRRDAETAFGIAEAMAAEIMFENDEVGPYKETEGERWWRMRRWVCDHVKETP